MTQNEQGVPDPEVKRDTPTAPVREGANDIDRSIADTKEVISRHLESISQLTVELSQTKHALSWNGEAGGAAMGNAESGHIIAKLAARTEKYVRELRESQQKLQMVTEKQKVCTPS
jgi:hypothetical protein